MKNPNFTQRVDWSNGVSAFKYIMGLCVCVWMWVNRNEYSSVLLPFEQWQTNNQRVHFPIPSSSAFAREMLLLDDVVQRVVRFGTRRIYQVKITDGIDLLQ